MADYDSPWKEALDRYFEAFLLFFFPHAHADPNPFALVVLAHLKAMETRKTPVDRQTWKVRLVKGLHDRGMKAEDLRQLSRFIDWMMDLPPALEALFREEIHRYEEEKRMPFI